MGEAQDRQRKAMNNGKPLDECFRHRWIPEPFSGCWLWTGMINQYNYGYIWYKGKRFRAHRISWQIHNGEIPAGLHVLHHCDTPLCVNPSHLFLGDDKANMLDCSNKGRIAHGERHHSSKLTAGIVREIRATIGLQERELAKQFGVCRSMIHSILARKLWKHV